MSGNNPAGKDRKIMRDQDTFRDWGSYGTPGRPELELSDNADSISVTVRTRSESINFEVDVRIAPGDLDRFQQWIADVRAKRGI